MSYFKMVRRHLEDSPNSESKEFEVVREADKAVFKRRFRDNYVYREASYYKAEKEITPLGLLQRVVKIADIFDAKIHRYTGLDDSEDFYLELNHPSKKISYVTLSVGFLEFAQEIRISIDTIRDSRNKNRRA